MLMIRMRTMMWLGSLLCFFEDWLQRLFKTSTDQIMVSCAQCTYCNATVPVSFVLTLETGPYDSLPLHTMCCENYLYLCLKSSHLLNAHKPLPLVVILPKIVFVISNISTNSQYKWKSDPSQATFKLLTQPRLWKVEFFSVSRRQKIKKVLDTSSHLN